MAISNAKKAKKGETKKFQLSDFKVQDKDKAEKKKNLDEFVGQKLLSMVQIKKQEILSKSAVNHLAAQPQLKDIADILNEGIQNHIAETAASVTLAEREYNQKKPLKWVIFAVGLVIGALLGYGVPKLELMLDSSKFSRGSLDKIMYGYFGAKKFPDMLTNELMVISYEYNSQEPRFFSKYMTAQNPGIYDVHIGNATASSSAAPTFFNPHEVINSYNLTELQIDGGTICNNPTLYTYELSKLMYGHKK